MSRVLPARRPVLAGPLLALALVVFGTLPAARAADGAGPRVGLGGYCPVCILDARKWVKGSPEHQAVYDGVTYYFPSAAVKQEFLASPAKHVPALGGDCIVCYAKLGKRVPGTVQHVARYDNRIFLFPGKEQRDAFLANPPAFADVDLALHGDCPVCLVNLNKHVPGKAEFTEIKDGFRYLFPSAREQAAFRKDPARYAAAAKAKEKQSKSGPRPGANGLVTVTGKTGCAGCEYGVTPVQNPEELGLAVATGDGKVVIVEQAHKLYASAYKNRYAGQQVRVSGRVIKQQGRFTWIDPTELTVLK
jgi:YHS domain-containing protein